MATNPIVKLCSIDNCEKPALTRGYCSAHYRKWWRHNGDPLWTRPKKPPQPCRIQGCANPARGEQLLLCSSHYQRLWRNGDPLAGGTFSGIPMAYYQEVVLPFDRDECLFWGFANSKGYGQLVIDGQKHSVHRLVCEVEHGPPPTDKHQAAHSCGNGHLGCVSRKHLFWKTAKQNSADKVTHGTQAFGEDAPLAKLSNEDVREIRKLIPHMNLDEIADIFGVASSTICAIKKGRRWKTIY